MCGYYMAVLLLLYVGFAYCVLCKMVALCSMFGSCSIYSRLGRSLAFLSAA